jgi:hypothetical protein
MEAFRRQQKRTNDERLRHLDERFRLHDERTGRKRKGPFDEASKKQNPQIDRQRRLRNVKNNLEEET